MKFIDFFSLNNKKLFISDSFSHAENIIKRCVLLTKKPIVDIERETLSSIAKNIYKKCVKEQKTMIDDSDGSFIVDYLIRSHNYPFIPQESYALSTSKVFYDAIKEIKFGKIVNPNNKRYLEVLPLIEDYNNYLIDNNLIDDADIIKESINHISIDTMGYGGDLVIGVTDNLQGKLRYLEQLLLDKLSEVYNQEVIYIDYTLDNQEIHNKKVDAYGFMNEIKYVVDDIRKNHINPGLVNLYVSDSSYNITIKSLFDYYHIPYYFVNGESAGDLSIISLFTYALDFVENLCDLQAIYHILISDAVKEEYKGLVPHLSKLKCDHVNIQEYNHKDLDENKKQFLDSLLLIDDEHLSIKDLFENLNSFVKQVANEEAYAVIKESISNIVDRLTYINEISCPRLFDKIQIIRGFIKSIKIHKNEDVNSIRILSLRDSLLLDRQYNYLIGLSASQLTLKETQSPVFSDNQLLDILSSDYYIHLARNNNSELMDDINKLLSTGSDGGHITYIFSSYDSVNFKQQAASTLYIDKQCEQVKADYEIDKGSLIKEENGIVLSPKMDKFSFSPSALETYAECPCKFLLQYIEGYGKVELAPYSNNWFIGGEFGTFCHLVLQKYSTINNTKDQQKKFDKKVFNHCVEEAKQETLALIPFGNQNAINADVSKAKYLVEEYLKAYFKNSDDYLTVACEYRFDKSDVGEVFEIDDKNIIVSYYGTIDRIDLKVDDEGQLHIRTIDYKTTSKSKIVSKINSGHAFQSHIYAIAAKSFVFKNKRRLEKALGKKLHFEKMDDIPSPEFSYVLLKEDPMSQVITVTPDKEALTIDNLRILIRSIMSYNDNFDLDEVLEMMNKTLSKESGQFKSDCQYCPFIRHCRYKINHGENLYPKAKPKEKGGNNE